MLIDNWLERRTRDRARAGAGIGFAMLAGVTLDGVPENLAMGVSLIEYGSVALLVAIFVCMMLALLIRRKQLLEGAAE